MADHNVNPSDTAASLFISTTVGVSLREVDSEIRQEFVTVASVFGTKTGNCTENVNCAMKLSCV